MLPLGREVRNPMDNRIFLERYRLSRGRNGLPVELYRSPAARTYRAQEIETGREVALTLVSPAPNDSSLLERLEAEAKAAEKINQAHIPRLYNFGRENDELVYVTEYCEGHTASAWVAARGPLTIGAVLRVALQVVDAINATAFQRLHHSALNPDNIIFVAGQTVEGDWPPVKVLHWFGPLPDLSETGNARIDSAVRFAAPEQLQSGEVDVRSEIYSLGATMWFLLTGSAPGVMVPGESTARVGVEKLRAVPKIVRHLLDRMLCTDPAKRPHDPVALAAYLQTCLARLDRRAKIERNLGVPLLAKARVAVAKPWMPIPIKPLAWAAGILALAALVILFLPWPLNHKRLASSSQEAPRVSENQPNEVAVVENDSLGRMSENEESESPAPESTSPAISPDEIPRDEMARTVQSTAADPNEPPAPGEGPDEAVTTPPPAVAKNSPTEQPAGTTLPKAESADTDSIAPPVIAETNEPHNAVSITAPDESAAITDDEPVKNAPASPPAKETAKTSLTEHATQKRSVASASAHSTTQSRKSVRVVRTAKRARPLPKLRVGSSTAELVGTTSDGRWILSVSESGRRIIVPPPPGYGE